MAVQLRTRRLQEIFLSEVTERREWGGVVCWAHKHSTLKLSEQQEQGLCLYASSTVLSILKQGN